MSHIVIVTSHMAGRINATCELARRLRRAGHTVTLASPVDIGERVAAQGMDFVYVGPPDKRARTHPAKPSLLRRIARLAMRLRTIRSVDRRRNEAVDALDLDRLTTAMRELAGDLYLIDIELPVEIMVASRLETTVAAWTTMLSLWKRPGLPPLHTDIVPGRGWRGSRIGMEWAWLRFRLWKWIRNQRLRITRVGTDQMSVLRRVAERTGFPIREETAPYHWLIPFVYRTLPTLSFNAREIEFPHEPDPTCHYVGPLLNASRRVADLDDEQVEISRRLESISARRRAGDVSSLVYCSFGAWHSKDDLSFIRTVVQAIGRRRDTELVVGLGGRVEPDALGEVPPDTHLFRWAPQLEVLSQADLAIHHAGISTINECVVSGVPMVVYPYDYGDTAGAAARVEFHRIGLRGDRTTDDEETIYRMVDRVLTDPSFRANVERLRDRYAEYERTDAAVAEVERLLASAGSESARR